MKEQIKEIGYWLEDKLKSLCGEITPDKRLAVIIIMLLLFTFLNLYLTFTSIVSWGREQERLDQLKIKHIKQPELEKAKPETFDFDLEELDSDINIYGLDSIDNKKTDKRYGG